MFTVHLYLLLKTLHTEAVSITITEVVWGVKRNNTFGVHLTDTGKQQQQQTTTKYTFLH